ncbi:MAG: hypothetical protein ACHRHE_06135, partial [Tepidisphaerales bacterium]
IFFSAELVADPVHLLLLHHLLLNLGRVEVSRAALVSRPAASAATTTALRLYRSSYNQQQQHCQHAHQPSRAYHDAFPFHCAIVFGLGAVEQPPVLSVNLN